VSDVENTPKIIAVTGATGLQGGGLVRAILADPDGGFVARAITRDPSSEKAKELERLGAEVVRADITDLDSLVRAFDGAYAAYCVTNYWEIFDPTAELAQAQNLATAVKQANIQHVIWSSLEDTRNWVPLNDERMPTLAGSYKVPHYDTKGEAEQYFLAAGQPTTFLMTSFYWENMINFGLGPHPTPAGDLVLNLPLKGAPLPGIAAKDIGASAYEIIKAGAPETTDRIGISGEHLTGTQMAASLTTALGRPVTYAPVSADQFRAFGFPGAEDLGNMFQFLEEFTADVVGAHPVEAARQRLPELETFDEWLAENAGRIPLE
jgi:uncharacterized protein YbjT (DUF2867 family)